MTEHSPVVIVGAGPTGVTAAIQLAQAGVPVVVLDRWAEVFPQPRAVHLDDEVFRILASLGVAAEFRAVSRPGAGLRLLSPDHRTLAQFDRTVPRTSNGFPQANMFDQPDLEALLRRRMQELDLAEFRGGVEVLSVVPRGAGAEIEYVDTADGRTRRLSATYVLGCDGANSLVRRAVGAEMVDQGFDPQRWLVVDIDTRRELGHWEGVHQVCDSRRAATYMRIGPTRHRWEFELLDQESAQDFDSLERLAPLLAPWDTDLRDFTVVRSTEYTFRAQIADRWRRGPMFLLGDAAHLTPPFIGQGMGAGVRDAANLTWKIAGVLGGTLGPDVLDSYQAERKPHARSMVRLAVLVGLSMTGGGRIGDLLRGVVVPALPRLPGLRGAVLDSTTPPLRGRRPWSNRRVGRLCPNAEVGGGIPVDQVVGDRWTLVVRRPLDPVARRRLPGHVAVVDPTSCPELGAWLGRTAAALVRPDRSVAAAGRLPWVLKDTARRLNGNGHPAADQQSAARVAVDA